MANVMNPTQMQNPGIAAVPNPQAQRTANPAPQGYAQPSSIRTASPQQKPAVQQPMARQPSPQQSRQGQPHPGNGKAVPPRGAVPQQQQARNVQMTAQAQKAPQAAASQSYPPPVQSPPISQQPAAAAALSGQYDNIAQQIGERLKTQMNNSIDEFVNKLAEELKNSLAGVADQQALLNNLQSANFGRGAGKSKTKKEGFFARRKAAKAAKQASKQPTAPKVKKPGFFSRFRKKKAATPSQQPRQAIQGSAQSSYPQAGAQANQNYPQQQYQQQQAYPQQQQAQPQQQQAQPQQQPAYVEQRTQRFKPVDSNQKSQQPGK